MSNKLFVGNLSFNTTENDLHDAFAAHGTVVEANLMMDRMSGRPRGFGFVTMSSPDEAQKAIEALNGKELDGRALTVNVARPREERPGGVSGRRGSREKKKRNPLKRVPLAVFWLRLSSGHGHRRDHRRHRRIHGAGHDRRHRHRRRRDVLHAGGRR
jgi:cold-inducible RNA-binding protein